MKLSRIVTATMIAAVAVASLNSCRSTRTSTPESGYETPGKAVKVSLSEKFKLMADSYTPWTTLSVPVKVNLTGSMKLSLSGTLTMDYGKAVSISMRKLFFDAGRLYVDNDSVIFSSSLLNLYYAEDMTKFTRATGLNLKDMQSMLIGQAFAPGKGTLTASDERLFSLTDAGSLTDGIRAIEITPLTLPAGAEWFFTAIAPEGAEEFAPRLFSIDISTSSASARVTYAESTQNQAGLTAASMQIEAKAKNRLIGATVTTTPAKAVWNEGVNLKRPSIPSGARKVTTEQLLKKL